MAANKGEAKCHHVRWVAGQWQNYNLYQGDLRLHMPQSRQTFCPAVPTCQCPFTLSHPIPSLFSMLPFLLTHTLPLILLSCSLTSIPHIMPSPSPHPPLLTSHLSSPSLTLHTPSLPYLSPSLPHLSPPLPFLPLVSVLVPEERLEDLSHLCGHLQGWSL